MIQTDALAALSARDFWGPNAPKYVGGALLTDPVAVSELLANTRQVDIKVPVDRVAEARDAVRSADAASHLLDDPSFDPGPRPDDV